MRATTGDVDPCYHWRQQLKDDVAGRSRVCQRVQGLGRTSVSRPFTQCTSGCDPSCSSTAVTMAAAGYRMCSSGWIPARTSASCQTQHARSLADGHGGGYKLDTLWQGFPPHISGHIGSLNCAVSTSFLVWFCLCPGLPILTTSPAFGREHSWTPCTCEHRAPCL